MDKTVMFKYATGVMAVGLWAWIIWSKMTGAETLTAFLQMYVAGLLGHSAATPKQP